MQLHLPAFCHSLNTCSLSINFGSNTVPGIEKSQVENPSAALTKYLFITPNSSLPTQPVTKPCPPCSSLILSAASDKCSIWHIVGMKPPNEFLCQKNIVLIIWMHLVTRFFDPADSEWVPRRGQRMFQALMRRQWIHHSLLPHGGILNGRCTGWPSTFHTPLALFLSKSSAGVQAGANPAASLLVAFSKLLNPSNLTFLYCTVKVTAVSLFGVISMLKQHDDSQEASPEHRACPWHMVGV